MKLTPARFIRQYNALGIQFELRNGVVVPVGKGVSPAFIEAVAQRSEWLKLALGAQGERMQSAQPVVSVESTHADRLVWNGIVNARRAEERLRAALGEVRG